MCELLGLSARYPVTLEMSFQKLMQRAELSNPDGWGAVFYKQNDAYVFREPKPAINSALATMGPTNFLYSDRLYLFAYSSRRSHADGVHPPGLHYISRQCDQKINSLPCIGLNLKKSMSKTQTLTLIASVPLSDEAWTPIAENKLLVLENGRILNQD